MVERISCSQVWLQAEPEQRAKDLDTHFPACLCESHSFGAEVSEPIRDGEKLARIFTSPGLYDLEDQCLIRSKLTAIHSRGLSIIRQNASDEEIVLTVRELIEGQSEPQTLVGAAFFRAIKVRSLGGEERWFCVYHTPSVDKNLHADLLGTIPSSESKAQQKKVLSTRRRALEGFLYAHIIRATTVAELIEILRK